MVISQYVVYFMFFSFLGWVWETIYCTAREKHFSNRGFLFGPICPIYGSSVVVGLFLFTQVDILSSRAMPTWQLFLICAVGSAFAEYGTSYYLEKRFHARWWDYSKLPLNIHGRICLPVTICFGLVGIVLVKWMIPVLDNVGIAVHPLIFEILALVLMGLMGADLALTEASLSTLLQKIQETDKEFAERAEAVYKTISSTHQQIDKRIKEFESEVHNRASVLAENLNLPQRSIVGSIKSFHTFAPSSKNIKVGEYLKDALRKLKKRDRI